MAVTRKLDIADIHCRMLPTIAPFLQHPVIQVDQEVLVVHHQYTTHIYTKLLERLVVRQLTDYLTVTKLLPPELQSAYRAFHSTETAVIKMLGDILR